MIFLKVKNKFIFLNTLAKNTFANTFTQIWNAILGILFIPVYSNLLGSEAMGLIGFYGSLNFVLSFLDFGLNSVLTREFSKKSNSNTFQYSLYNLFRTTEIIIFIVALIFGVLFHLFSNWISVNWLNFDYINHEQVSNCIKIMGWMVSVRLIEGVYKSVFNGIENHILITKLNFIFSSIRSIGVILALNWVSNSILLFFLWQLVFFIIPVLVYMYIFYKQFDINWENVKFSLKYLSGNWNFAGGIFVLSVLSLFLTQLDKVFLSKYVKLGDFGLYSIASSVSFMTLFVSYPIVNSFYPRLVYLYHNNNQSDFKFYYHKSSQFITYLSSNITFFLYFFSNEILLIWGIKANSIEIITNILQPLVLGNLFSAIILIPYQIHIVTGKLKTNLLLNLLLIFIFPFLYYQAIKIYGASGASFIYLLFNIVYFLLFTLIFNKKLIFNEKKDWLINDVIKIMLFSFIVTYIIKSVYKFINFYSPNLFLIILIFCIIFILTIFPSKHIKNTLKFLKPVKI